VDPEISLRLGTWNKHLINGKRNDHVGQSLHTNLDQNIPYRGIVAARTSARIGKSHKS